MTQQVRGLSRDQREHLQKRLTKAVESEAWIMHLVAIAAWAAEDESPLPTIEEAMAQAEFELTTLLNGLGSLAALEDRDLGQRFSGDYNFDEYY